MTCWRDEARQLAWWPALTDTRTRPMHMTPREMVQWFAHPVEAMPKHQLPGWSACACVGNRASANVTELAAFVVDADGVPLSLADAVGGVPFAAWGHTSASHGVKLGGARWRMVIWTDRPMTPEEYRACWPVVVDVLVGMGVPMATREAPHGIDAQCKDLCRLWYVPCQGPHYQHAYNQHAPVRVEKLLQLARASSLAPIASAKPRDPAQRPQARGEATPERIERYLDACPPAISGSAGHTTTLQTAMKLIGTFGLSADETFSYLWTHYNPRCQPAWSERELRRKCAEAARIKGAA